MVFSLDMVDPELIHDVVLMEPNYAKNRERVAVLVHQGFSLWDSFQAAKPWIFATSIAVAAGSGYMWWRRGWKKTGRKVGEAHVLYPLTLLVSTALAWFSRPTLFPSYPQEAAADVPAPTEDSGGFITYLDTKADELEQEDPHFANRAFSRLVNVPAVKEYWQATPEQIQAFLHYDPRGIYRPR